MYQLLPDKAYELILDPKENFVYVFNLNGMKDMLSGDEKAKPFCIITTERVYFYSLRKGNDVQASVCDINDISDVEVSTIKKPAKLLNLIYSVPSLLLFRFFARLSIKSLSNVMSVFATVFFGLDAVILLISGLTFVVRAVRMFLMEQHAIMHVITKIGIFSFELPGLATGDIKTFEEELFRAKAMRKSVNPEVFTF